LIVIFNGPPGAGKDAACLFFKKLGYTHLSFKEQLFIETCKYFNVNIDWFMSDYDNRAVKEKKVDELNGYSRREAMIYTSEEYIKPNFGKEYFGKRLAENIDGISNFCVSDGGFVEELTPIINKIGAENIVLVQLTRDGCDFSSDSRKYFNGDLLEEFILGKKTEIEKQYMLDDYFPIRTYRVHNNGTIADFEAALHKIHEKGNNDRQINKEKGGNEESIL
jgi:hypothetical protein